MPSKIDADPFVIHTPKPGFPRIVGGRQPFLVCVETFSEGAHQETSVGYPVEMSIGGKWFMSRSWNHPKTRWTITEGTTGGSVGGAAGSRKRVLGIVDQILMKREGVVREKIADWQRRLNVSCVEDLPKLLSEEDLRKSLDGVVHDAQPGAR
ncbi:hypothetical protein LCGC14_0412110 [marine sediment metagenome]|uniref:Uncharacterized protein n=1 Tax=marine sediment metagenome TaxID=412755 RepID=A0A0F9STI6_9ZZZZ